MSDGKKRRGKVKKLFMFGGAGFLGLAAVGFTAVYFVSQSKMGATYAQDVTAIEIPEGDSDAIARGDYLVNHVMGCTHSDCHGADLGGGAVVDAFPMGRIYAPNITDGEGSVVNDYETEDWLRAIRHGIKKDGTRALIMPSEDYINFSDADIGATIAYIKSREAVDRESIGHALGPVSRLLIANGEIKFAYDKIDHDAKPPKADPGPTKEWGEVLMTTCTGCHGEGLSGGRIPGTDPSWPEARNITHHETGIHGWEYDDFKQAMTEGKRPDGTELSVVMPWKAYAGMSEDDLTALWLYLETVEPKPAGGR